MILMTFWLAAPMAPLGLGVIGLLALEAGVNVPTREIVPGVFMPLISIGTGGLESKEALNITRNWLEIGGRGIDTAYVYGNQDIVAKAIADVGVSRQDTFITTKIPGCLGTQHFVERDLELLGTDYIDLMLIHDPKPETECEAAWAILEDYYRRGVLKAIGISNFRCDHIQKLMRIAKVVPAVNQIQHNILEHHDDIIACMTDNNIRLEAYSPMGRSGESGNISGNPVIKSIASHHNVSNYQVASKWILQHGHLLTFQSTSKEHQESDADVFKFNLTEAEMSMLDELGASMSHIVV